MRIAVLLFVLSSTLAPAGAAQQLIAVPDSGFVAPRALAVHPGGDLFVTGGFSGTVDFNPAGEPRLLTARGQDAFLARYRDGVCLWVVGIGGAYGDGGGDVALTADAVYVSGSVERGEATFGPAGAAPAFGSTGRGFLARYDLDGTLAWGVQVGGAPSAIVPDGGELVVAGGYVWAFDFEPGAGEQWLDAGTAGYVARYSARNGYFRSALALGGTPLDVLRRADRGLVATGFFGSDAGFQPRDFDPGPGEAILTSRGESDVFVVALEPDGVLAWAFRVGGDVPGSEHFPSGRAFGSDVAVDAAGDVYVAGQFGGGVYRFERPGTMDFDAGPDEALLTTSGATDAFVARYDAAGAYVWARSIGSAEDGRSPSIAATPDGAVYVVASGRIARLAPEGEVAWQVDLDLAAVATAVVVDDAGRAVVAGYVDGGVDLDPGPGERLLEGRGAFVVAYHADGTVGVGAEREVPEEASAPRLSAYPNPVTTAVRLTLTPPTTQSVAVQVFDLLGRSRTRPQVRHCLADAGCAWTLDVAALPAGVYLVRARGASFVATRSVVVGR